MIGLSPSRPGCFQPQPEVLVPAPIWPAHRLRQEDRGVAADLRVDRLLAELGHRHVGPARPVGLRNLVAEPAVPGAAGVRHQQVAGLGLDLGGEAARAVADQQFVR